MQIVSVLKPYTDQALSRWILIKQYKSASAKLGGLLLVLAVLPLVGRMNGLEWTQFCQRLTWKLRPYFSRHILPRDIARWRLDGVNVDDLDMVTRLRKENNSWWTFLTPFFAAYGYSLHVPIDDNATANSYPYPLHGKPTSRQVHPYARRLYCTNRESTFKIHVVDMMSKLIRHLSRQKPCVRGARDKCGRDVVIRIVSGPEHSKELKVLEYLTSPSALKDPRNITIPILDWLEFDGLIFIVMPKWDQAWMHDVGTVAECIHIADVLLAIIREIVPEIISFIEWMRSSRPSDRPTAREAYLKFQELKTKLTAEQLEAPLSDIFYDGSGRYQKKYAYKTRPKLPDHNWRP
ncbi:hypothetical protein CVT24_001405 [Panaeolus cyanescens]|uniref:Uncharacterized protein n=1 Tax=Panaeolus cyanescens TaxID=181874 RepID=A0A409W3G0_9AGAR|nr:hypothetical protein CVT24_001405 [Panaeolus cyanescens]